MEELRQDDDSEIRGKSIYLFALAPSAHVANLEKSDSPSGKRPSLLSFIIEQVPRCNETARPIKFAKVEEIWIITLVQTAL